MRTWATLGEATSFCEAIEFEESRPNLAVSAEDKKSRVHALFHQSSVSTTEQASPTSITTSLIMRVLFVLLGLASLAAFSVGEFKSRLSVYS